MCLGTHHGRVGENMVKEIKDKFVYVPLLKVLENLLKCPAVYEDVSHISRIL